MKVIWEYRYKERITSPEVYEGTLKKGIDIKRTTINSYLRLLENKHFIESIPEGRRGTLYIPQDMIRVVSETDYRWEELKRQIEFWYKGCPNIFNMYNINDSDYESLESLLFRIRF